MGVPAFFRWISNKYPFIISNCFEARKIGLQDVDMSLPNPNGFEIDNLYLDMNGIIHPCTHPENKDAPPSLEEMFKAITDYIDRILLIVRPRRLLYMAIDGVAPRAKMNQQRSRRFRSARDKKNSEETLNNMRDIVKKKGYNIPAKREELDFDSNCITPGTDFMRQLKEYLVAYINQSLATVSGWQDLLVILSDSSVPGEGEHKIMDYIRRQRGKVGYDPNMVHCIYGADADLIMLGLATHEPNFIIIREEFNPVGPNKPCPVCYKVGHCVSECKGIDAEDSTEPDENEFKGGDPEFLFIKLNVLREYLKRDFYFSEESFTLDFERMIDDWILICFLVGNDFLPHLPSLEIREGAIDRIWNLYQNRIIKLKGYLCENGKLDIENFKIILYDLGQVEDQIFKRRTQRQKMFEENRKNALNLDKEKWERDSSLSTNITSNDDSNISVGTATKRKSCEATIQDDSLQRAELILDEIRLGEEGWKIRYYTSKFRIQSSEIDSYRKRLASEYLTGVSWVLQYYYQGCASWKWSYPFHYSPFASDFILVNSEDIEWKHEFDPFKPYEQLMGVLPESSKDLIPKCYHFLMQSYKSEIIDFYPKEFIVDLNGKRQEWQGVALIPFIDESRLRQAMLPVNHKLTEDEFSLNEFGENLLFMRETNVLGELIIKNTPKLDDRKYVSLEEISYNKMFGDIKVIDSVKNSKPFSKYIIESDNTFQFNHILCMIYRDSLYPKGYIFRSTLLENALLPKEILKPKNKPSDPQNNPTVFQDYPNRPIRLGDEAKRMIQHSFYPNQRHPRPQNVRTSHRRYSDGNQDYYNSPQSNFSPRFHQEYRQDFRANSIYHSQKHSRFNRDNYERQPSYHDNHVRGRINYNNTRPRYDQNYHRQPFNDRDPRSKYRRY